MGGPRNEGDVLARWLYSVGSLMFISFILGAQIALFPQLTLMHRSYPCLYVFYLSLRWLIEDVCDDVLVSFSDWLVNRKKSSGNHINRILLRVISFLEWYQTLLVGRRLVGSLGQGAQVTISLRSLKSKQGVVRSTSIMRWCLQAFLVQFALFLLISYPLCWILVNGLPKLIFVAAVIDVCLFSLQIRAYAEKS